MHKELYNVHTVTGKLLTVAIDTESYNDMPISGKKKAIQADLNSAIGSYSIVAVKYAGAINTRQE